MGDRNLLIFVVVCLILVIATIALLITLNHMFNQDIKRHVKEVMLNEGPFIGLDAQPSKTTGYTNVLVKQKSSETLMDRRESER